MHAINFSLRFFGHDKDLRLKFKNIQALMFCFLYVTSEAVVLELKWKNMV